MRPNRAAYSRLYGSSGGSRPAVAHCPASTHLPKKPMTKPTDLVADVSPAVRAVCERFGAAGAQPVLAAIDGFLDASPRWSLMLAALVGLPRLVERLSRLRPAPFDQCCTEAMDAAAEFGHLSIVQWLHKNRSEGCTTDAMDLAACNGHLDVIQWLHEHRTEGCTTNAMDFAAQSGHLEVVQWLHEHRPEGCTRDAMDNAAGRGHLHVLEWLHAHRSEGCSRSALVNAVNGGHRPVARWLLLHQRKLCGARAVLSFYLARRDPRGLADWLFEQSYLQALLADEEEEGGEEEDEHREEHEVDKRELDKEDERLRALVLLAFEPSDDEHHVPHRPLLL